MHGDTYKQSSNTKDREVAQIKVLNGLGWDIYRIWALDWWDNKEKEISKLIQNLQEANDKARRAKEEAERALVEAQNTDVIIEDVAED